MLALLANKEITIEALKRELADKKSAAEKQVQREGKLKGQIKKLKAMLKPLGDELVFQRSELGRVKSEAELQKSEVEARGAYTTQVMVSNTLRRLKAMERL